MSKCHDCYYTYDCHCGYDDHSKDCKYISVNKLISKEAFKAGYTLAINQKTPFNDNDFEKWYDYLSSTQAHDIGG